MKKYKGFRLPSTSEATAHFSSHEGGDNTLPTWRKRRKITFTMADMVNNIVNDSNLSLSYGNPDFYPPVPKYTPPEQTIRGENLEKTGTIIKKEGFAETSIIVTRSPLHAQDFDAFDDEIFYLNSIFTNNTIIHQENIPVITGNQRAPNYSYPNIAEQTAYRVVCILDTKTQKEVLAGIYVFQNPGILRKLLEFLASLEVSNDADLREAQINLGELYFSITNGK